MVPRASSDREGSGCEDPRREDPSEREDWGSSLDLRRIPLPTISPRGSQPALRALGEAHDDRDCALSEGPDLDRLDQGIEIWRLDCRPFERADLSPPVYLSALERRRFAAMRHPTSRAHFAGGRWLVREILSGYTGKPPHSIDIGVDARGRPFAGLASKPWGSVDSKASPLAQKIDFNLSHSGGDIVLALAIAPKSRRGRFAAPTVGIDIERVDPHRNWQAIAERRFSLAERRGLRLHGDEQARCLAFFRTWVRKEAFVKALGSGISTNFQRFDVTTGAVAGLEGLRIEGEECERWTIRDLQLSEPSFDEGGFDPGIVGAIAWRSLPSSR